MKRFEGWMHGVDLGGWFSQCDHTEKRYDTFVTEEDFARIRAWGLDHVRLPVDYDLLETRDGLYKEKGFGRLATAIGWAGKHGLNLILDLHKTFGYSFDAGEKEEGFFGNAAYQERFYKLWEEIARRFGQMPERVAFELLNEVTSRDYCDAWNRISGECVRRIRAIAPDVKILIGGYDYNSVYAVKDLALPADENVVYNFHCYQPFPFTHQGAYWVDGMDRAFRTKFALTYGEYRAMAGKNPALAAPGTEAFPDDETIGPAYFEGLVEEAVRVAEERGVALYCGEYGVIDLAEPEDALAWYRMITACFDRHGIGRAAWSYREMDFGLVDDHMKGVIGEVVKCL